jgi:hypothetical protein
MSPSQSPKPALHVMAHLLPAQLGVPLLLEQTVSQPPQWFGSVVVSTHVDAHIVPAHPPAPPLPAAPVLAVAPPVELALIVVVAAPPPPGPDAPTPVVAVAPAGPAPSWSKSLVQPNQRASSPAVATSADLGPIIRSLRER